MGENDRRNYSKLRNIICIRKDTEVGKSKYQLKIQIKYIPFIKQSDYNVNYNINYNINYNVNYNINYNINYNAN